jgi:hypothetical protein
MSRNRVTPTARQHAIQMEIAENGICAAVGQKLEEQYPGYHWYVECVWKTGTVVVKNLNINGDYGFLLHLEKLMLDNDMHLVTHAGGELLERCGLPRSRKPEDISHLKRDAKGNVSEDSMDMETSGGEF